MLIRHPREQRKDVVSGGKDEHERHKRESEASSTVTAEFKESDSFARRGGRIHPGLVGDANEGKKGRVEC